MISPELWMISPLIGRCKGEIRVYLRERKDFFDFTKFSMAFSLKCGQKGDFLRWVSGWDVWGDATRPTTFSLFSIIKRKSAYLWAKVGTFGRKSINALPELMMT